MILSPVRQDYLPDRHYAVRLPRQSVELRLALTTREYLLIEVRQCKWVVLRDERQINAKLVCGMETGDCHWGMDLDMCLLLTPVLVTYL